MAPEAGTGSRAANRLRRPSRRRPGRSVDALHGGALWPMATIRSVTSVWAVSTNHSAGWLRGVAGARAADRNLQTRAHEPDPGGPGPQ
jgi:hypothetical protein